MAEVKREFDVLVVGAGPAGMAAACAATDCSASVGIVDDNQSPGGQIWRGEAGAPSTPEAATLYNKFSDAKIPFMNAAVFAQAEPGMLLAESGETVYELRYGKLILATGARERFLPFPGWTLPNVVGAGGLQALVKSGLPIASQRVVVAGSGPLLFAVGAYLKKQGAHVLCIAEQAGRAQLARFVAGLWRFPGKAAQALRLRGELGGVPYLLNCWPVAAKGAEKLKSVTLQQGEKRWDVPCDYLACGFHLTPNTELAELIGCEVQEGCVRVNQRQETSVPDVLCAGEPTGIGGAELALVEGEIAGYVAGRRETEAEMRFGERRKLRRFARLLEQTFRLRAELKGMAQAETIVCRCEDVPLGRLRGHTSWRAAKLETRCGMGPCQGRVCGPAVEFLLGWKAESVRPPVFPVRVAALAASKDSGGQGAMQG